MTPDAVLSHQPRILTQAQREHYFEHGYVGVESLVPADILAELVSVTNEFVEASRSETKSGRRLGHDPQLPRPALLAVEQITGATPSAAQLLFIRRGQALHAALGPIVSYL